MTEIIQMAGSREEKIAKAKRIKEEMATKIPEMLDLRQQLIEAGMCADNFSSISRLVTDNIDYSALRDDPFRYHKRYEIEPYITEEIQNAVQDRKSHPFSAAELVLNSRRSSRSR